MNNQLTVNLHITKKCNYRCTFCYAHFRETKELSLESLTRLLEILSEYKIRKINFAGGEPLLYKGFGELLSIAKDFGFIVSLITNGSMISKEWIESYGRYLDIFGISCDSANPKTLKLLGRGKGESVENTKKVFGYIDEFNEKNNTKIFKKLNTVVTRLNFEEDMCEFVESLNVNRWKIFQVLPIEGENDLHIDNLTISKNQFQKFIDQHIQLNEKGIRVVPENNDAMTDSYLMINPDGKFYQNTNGKHHYSSSILKVGIEKALSEINFDLEKFYNRGGFY
jgi:radical S-adenosyl methionine domain-containing protein 2